MGPVDAQEYVRLLCTYWPCTLLLLESLWAYIMGHSLYSFIVTFVFIGTALPLLFRPLDGEHRKEALGKRGHNTINSRCIFVQAFFTILDTFAELVPPDLLPASDGHLASRFLRPLPMMRISDKDGLSVPARPNIFCIARSRAGRDGCFPSVNLSESEARTSGSDAVLAEVTERAATDLNLAGCWPGTSRPAASYPDTLFT